MSFRSSAVALSLASILAACGSSNSGTEVVAPLESAAAPAPTPPPVTEADIMRPDIYDQTDMGLWDGRPSIGGTWIAHPTVTQAERVRITNLANGASITGALFARDPSLPGPPFLLSGEAAAVLGAEPGVPTQFRVTALRREIVNAETNQRLETEPLEVAVPATPASLPASTVETATPTPAPQVNETALSTLDRPFIQVGAFGVPQNAANLAERLRSRGYPVETKSEQGRTRTLTLVLIGPAQSEAERDALRERLRGDGFTDTLLTAL